ncbi:hypothetical protein SAMN05192574_106119 [Mucilaginibacter gossypiicola]|uniref:Uncharacterized protein n=1 Tax=Mucilaginibacter gossypiicola TaxID=551995 RepID=A0A1H8MWN8_9SPHI|nr:hypothetical protein [Mucilaginibacter gossypiicola]SEO21666.1 hypothetical protein SAMN05192574_106119 [Mucilaginibacter gossypiicola]
MKYPGFMLAIAVTLLFSACKKKECCNIQVAPDFIIAQKNNIKWEADPSGSNILGDTITVSAKSNIAGEEEQVGFKIVFDGVGYYTLKANENYYRITKNNILTGKYAPDPTHLSSATIISYNQTDKILQGFFELRFLKASDSPVGSHPDKVSFSEGKFKVKLKY